MHKNLQRAAAALMGGLALSTTSMAAAPVATVNLAEVYQHLVARPTPVPTAWQDLTTPQASNAGWQFHLTVDATGKVIAARLKDGPGEDRDAATRAARALRFHPFERDGHAVPVQFDFSLQGAPTDYAGPADRAFPDRLDPARLRVALVRSACYGACPAYRVEVRGDGEVTYRGDHHVLVEGEQHWRVPADTLAPLIALLRQSDYFKLGGYYRASATDMSTFVTRVDTGLQRKFVLDYGGRMLKDEAAPGQTPRTMPDSVTAIEHAIDAVSGVASRVRGDEHTMAVLRDAGWDFHAPAAGAALNQLVADCKTSLAIDFLRAGAPLDTAPSRGFQPPLLGAAARCGDLDLARELESRGALARPQDADAFLADAAGNGYPDFVALALKHGARATHVDEQHTPVIARAAQASPHVDSLPRGDAVFDPARVIALLVGAGADPNVQGQEGDRPLHSVASAANARALIAAGADARALNVHHQTALFTQYDAGVVPVLVQAGTDVAATDDEGHTALETTNSEDVALALLAAGAKPPAGKARRDAFVKNAAGMNWSRLLPLIDGKNTAR